MKQSRALLNRLGLGSLILLVLPVVFTAPAGAAALSGPLVAAAKPWHFWIAPIVAVSTLGLFGMLALGYAFKVLTAKYGVRIGRR